MKNNKSKKNTGKKQQGKSVFMSRPIEEGASNSSALKRLASNKHAIYIVIAVLVVIIAVLIAVFAGGSGASDEVEPSQEVASASPSPTPSPTPAITPPADDGDPASGSDIILEPEQRPATDSDLVSIDPG